MTIPPLAFRVDTEQACNWLAQQTGTQWTLARLLENDVTPYVWLNYDAANPALFGDANGGYAAPIFFAGDTQRLAAGSADVLITMTKNADNIFTPLPAPGLRRALHDLRFLRKDLERLARDLKRQAAPQSASTPQESTDGISKSQVLTAFASLVKIDLEQALSGGIALFGDDGARVKGSARKAKNKALWNPVTLALGLNDTYRVPMAHLKKVFNTHDFLHAWRDAWQQSLDLLGK